MDFGAAFVFDDATALDKKGSGKILSLLFFFVILNSFQHLPKFGESPPNFGEASPNFGEGLPNFGEAPPKFGESSPNFGESSPNFGEVPPKFGESSPNFLERQIRKATACFFNVGAVSEGAEADKALARRSKA